MLKLIETGKRSQLHEGRSYQMGFAICRQTFKDAFTTLHPISACKDYLNDVVACEMIDRSFTIYGLTSKNENFLKDSKRLYMAIKILPNIGGSDYPNMTKDKQNLNSNYLNLNKFINNFEEKLGVKLKTKIIPIENDTFIVVSSKQWVNGLYAISCLGLLLRVGQWYTGEGDVMEYLKNFNQFAPDVYMVKQLIPNLEGLIETGLIQENFAKYKDASPYQIHNNGILALDIKQLQTDVISESNEEEEWDEEEDEDEIEL